MSEPTRSPEDRTARQGRIVALVIAGSMLLWLAANALGAAMGWPGRVAILFDLAVLAALIWAFVNIYDIWRKRRDNNGN